MHDTGEIELEESTCRVPVRGWNYEFYLLGYTNMALQYRWPRCKSTIFLGIFAEQ